MSEGELRPIHPPSPKKQQGEMDEETRRDKTRGHIIIPKAGNKHSLYTEEKWNTGFVHRKNEISLAKLII